uniref:integrase core domain-containing protein n=1 Tax=Streptomyces malaysiensis TaxID=92644 RepID=UPI0020C5FDA7|nr:integrase core domain-containing protein [Streptomyces samsunensis]
MYLKRYHDVTISKSGVWRILHRLGMGRLPASQCYKRHDKRWKRYEKQLPSHRVQIDVKFIEPLASMRRGRRGGRNKYFRFTAIDDCTRLRVLRIYPALNQTTAVQFLDYVIQRLPFQVEVIQTDNGAAFQSAFHWHVPDKGIAHTYIKPRTPRLNGKVERSHRIDAEVFNDKLREWEDYYNYHRPHGDLGGPPPTNASSRRPRPRRNRRSSVAQPGQRPLSYNLLNCQGGSLRSPRAARPPAGPALLSPPRSSPAGARTARTAISDLPSTIDASGGGTQTPGWTGRRTRMPVIGGVRGNSHPVCRRPRQSRADAAPGVQVVRTVARST